MPYSRLFYHFVWATKNRLPLITERNRDGILRSIAAKVRDLRGICHAVNAMPDHVHLVATVPPAISPAAFVGQVKGVSSHLASRLTVAEVDPFAWQSEYGVLTVSESHLKVVVAYVVNQQQHHAEHTIRANLEHLDE